MNWSLFFSAINSVGLLALAFIAYLHSRRVLRLQAIGQYIGYWRELDRLLLESPNANRALNQLLGREGSDSDSLRHLIFIYINQALVAHYATRFGDLPARERNDEYRAIWRILSHQKDLADKLVRSESFPQAFIDQFLAARPADSH